MDFQAPQPYNSADDNGIEQMTPQRFEAPRIDSLPEELLQKILRYVLPVRVTINPWFNCGTSTHGIRGFGLDDEHITFKPNIDAGFLRVSKECHRLGTNIIYSSGHFRFPERPDCCKWWLKRIGGHNIRKIRRMTLILGTGWRYDRRIEEFVSSPFEQSIEEQWFEVLKYILEFQPRLEYLNLKLKGWSSMRLEPNYNKQDKEELERYRKMLVDQFTKFRGIKRVKIQELGAKYIGEEARRIELLMQQPLWTLPPKPISPKLNLRQLIEHCRKENEVKERRIEEAMLIKG